MNFIGNKIMDVVYQCFQNDSGKSRCTAYQDSGKHQKLIPAQPVVQPMQNKFIAACFF